MRRKRIRFGRGVGRWWSSFGGERGVEGSVGGAAGPNGARVEKKRRAPRMHEREQKSRTGGMSEEKVGKEQDNV
jgi:hypothetical protein